MNKNKLIFAIIGIILLILLFIVVLNLKKSTSDNKTKTNIGNFSIWVIGDSIDNSRLVIENFKKVYPEFSNKTINIESFANYDDYSNALTTAIIQDKAPDIFVLNNNEKNSIFSNQVIGIDKVIINPNDFRKKYKGFLSDDLIVTLGEGDQKEEFLAGIPVGYETLGIFYNRRYVKDSDLSSLSSLNNVIAELKSKYKNLVPIGIGNGSTVYGVTDIVTQFFMLEEGVTSINDVTGNKLKQALAGYLLYGDSNGDNGFNSRFLELTNLGQNSIDLFSKGETFMVVGYPRMINQIKEKGFSKNFLLASPFPHYFSGNGKTLVNYNYFVINKDTKDYSFANQFLGYLASDIGATDYLSNFPYYLPALLSLESDKLDEKISKDYNIILGNFLNTDYELSSFDKGIKNYYDKNLVSLLDNSSNYEITFNKFRSSIICKAKKIATLENLSENCE